MNRLYIYHYNVCTFKMITLYWSLANCIVIWHMSRLYHYKQVSVIPHMQEIQHPATLPVTLGTYIAYRICNMFECTNVLIYLEHKNKYHILFFMDFSLISYISVKHWLCVHLALLTLTWFSIDYHVNKDTRFLVFHYHSIYNTSVLQLGKLIISRSQSYVSGGTLKIHQARTC